MKRPGYRASAPSPRVEREVVNVDYADVLRQAVDNERWRVLREIGRAVDAISTSGRSSGYNSWERQECTGNQVKAEVKSALERIERGGQ